MNLGREQQQAAALGAGAVRVVAGAGTGKTAVIAERFRRLVATGISPASILVMTFTERAAREMRERIEDLTDTQAPAVGTVHSIALAWLREDGGAIGVPPGFRILMGADRWILARELMWGIGDAALTGDERPDDLVAPALQMLERMKQELVPLERLESWAASTDDKERADLMSACIRLFRAYERDCRKHQFLDFDDLLVLAVRLLEKNPALRRRYAARFPHVLVDEYQDLNLAQERLVELVARECDPFVVGDDDQSIYRFRGASRASLERFLVSFPSARTITLGRNRRSSRRIVSAAATLIEHNPDRLSKHLRSEEGGAAVQLWSCEDGTSEADAIAQEADQLVEAGTRPSSIAVLCRTNAIARPIAAALAAHGLPHVVIGGHGFHDRPEIRDMIAMLRVIRDPGDLVALARPAAAALQPLLELPASVLEPLVRGREDVVAEERRLLYVAMTRARRRLYLTRAIHYEGGRRWRESRFLDEVRAAGPRTVVETEVAGSPASPPQAVVDGHTGEIHLSYSAITAYKDCPRQYWYRHVERLPAIQSAEAVHGVILHEVLRRAGELRQAGKPVSAERLRSIHTDVWSKTVFPDPRRAPACKRNGAAELEAYRSGGGFELVPAYLEQPFALTVDGWNLRGVIDRIDRTADGWRIIDYKSGRPIARRRRDLQVALYAPGSSSAIQIEPVELEVVYLASGESAQVGKVADLMRNAEAEGTEVAEGIRAGRFETKPERRRCRLCPYRLACADAL